jgi:hypothetical protein
MSTRTAQTAMSHNNEGISHLEKQNFEAAAKSFSKGLSLIKRVLSSGEWDDLTSKVFRDSSSQITPVCQFYKLQGLDSSMAVDDEEERPDSLGQEGFVFKEPIMILPQPLDIPGYSYFVKLSFIQLYNLALSHHLCALQKPNQEPFLRKALSLYELAYTIHVSEDVELSILQSMAIVNNLGFLHRRLDNEEKANQCFDNLLTTLMFVKDCGEQDNRQMLDGFLSNVMSLILSGHKSAAAA